MNTILFFLLYPLSILYKLITSFRNHLYDIKHFHSFDFQIKTISVGNLTVGGTGKTPHVEYLIKLLKSNYQICTLSRGYGRKTRGIIFASPNTDAREIGDEPMQYYLKYRPEISVVVGEDRALAIPTIIHELANTSLILLDDAYQHRAVVPGFNILLCDYNNPFFYDYLMPAGRLRESRIGARRADVVLVSKCPDTMPIKEKEHFRKSIAAFTKDNTPVFFTGIRYSKPIALFECYSESKNAILVSGIANPKVFTKKIGEQYKVVDSIMLKDHHAYSIKEIDLIKSKYSLYESENPIIITTEKDMVKLIAFKEALQGLPIYYIPIEVYFLAVEEQNSFENIIQTYLKRPLAG